MTKVWEVLHKGKVKGQKAEELIEILLRNRKITDRKEFFNPTHPSKLTLKELGVSKVEIAKAVKRIREAKKKKEKVFVYGDYDADGVCATAILWEALYGMGLDALPYIPERFSEGYGINAESVKKLKAQNPNLKLIVTVDNGIVAGKAVEEARGLGVEVIVTDHHEKGKRVPDACAIVHTTKIGGAALAWVLARELGYKEGLELAGVGTIADQLPLVGVNRSFAKHGLAELAETRRVGMLELMAAAGIKEVGTYEVNYLIAPRINAMGRMSHALEALRLLCTRDRGKAMGLAATLNRANSERQKILESAVAHARGMVRREEKEIIVLADESYHEGVIGLIAGKLVEEFYRPAIVLSKKGEVAKASARSINGFNIIEAIRRHEDFLIEGGGHPMAAGFSMETARIAEFRAAIKGTTEKILTDEILARKLRVDLEVQFDQLNYQLAQQLKEFEPCGMGNPSPLLASRGVEIVEARGVGAEGKHLKLKVKQEGIFFDAIAFGFGASLPKLKEGKRVDLLFSFEENVWNGSKSLQLKIKDMRSNG